MHVSRRARTLAFAAGSVPLLLALSLHGQPAPPSPTPAETPQQVADVLDKIVQPRFQDVTAGQFGLTRLAPAARGHHSVGYQGYFKTNTPAEATLLASADAPHRRYIIAFLHCAHVPGQPLLKQSPTLPPADPDSFPTRLSTIVVSGTPNGYPVGYSEKIEPVLRQAAVRSLPAAMKGRNAQTAAGDLTVFLRPVRASQASCLTCHAGAKRGDTLGVMVYGVSNTVGKN